MNKTPELGTKANSFVDEQGQQVVPWCEYCELYDREVILHGMLLGANRKLAAYQKAEMPEEPKWLKDFDRSLLTKDSADRDLILYADALRAYAARMTVERDEVEKKLTGCMNRLNPDIEYVEGIAVGYGADEIDRLQQQLAATKEAQARAESLIADHNKECEGLCVGQPKGHCDSYITRGRQCPDCPRNWKIDSNRAIAKVSSHD